MLKNLRLRLAQLLAPAGHVVVPQVRADAVTCRTVSAHRVTADNNIEWGIATGFIFKHIRPDSRGLIGGGG